MLAEKPSHSQRERTHIVQTHRQKKSLTPTCPEQWYGMLHGGHSKLGQAELLELQHEDVLHPQIRQL